MQRAFTPLHKAVTESVLSVTNTEIRKMLANQVLLVGGGSELTGLGDALEEKLINYLPFLAPACDSVNVIFNSKGVDNAATAWKGAAIMCLTEAARDQWVTRDEWRRLGVRALRERVAFNWMEEW
jgi:actin-related protein